MAELNLSDCQIEQFHEDGFLVLRSTYDSSDIEGVRRGIYDTIGRVIQRHDLFINRAAYSSDNFDAGYSELIQLDRAYGSEVYDAVKYIPAFWRLVTHPLNEQITLQLRRGSHPAIAAGGLGIRIDNPNEDRFRAQWHQEYPAQLRSLNGLVFWSSLLPMSDNLGPIRVCKGSHVEGPLPVTSKGSDAARHGAYSILINNENNYLQKYPEVSPITNPGDLIIIDFLTIHASGFNRSSRPRWTMQFRYFDLAEPVGMAHGWKGSFAAGVDFRQIHPNLWVDDETHAD